MHILYFDHFLQKTLEQKTSCCSREIDYLISISDPEIPGLVISKESRI